MASRPANVASTRIAPCAPFASSTPGIPAQLRRFAEMQALFLAIAAVIYGILWAIQPETTRLSVVLVYTLCLCNFTAFGLECLNFLYAERSPLTFWLGFISILIVLTSVNVPATAAIVFYAMKRPGGPFLNYLGANWKFAAVATIAFGIAAQIYEVMKFELERRNQELRETVEQDAAVREAQEQELERGREMQQALMPKEIPQIEGFEIAGKWVPAGKVGGDYFDVIRLGEKKLGICIGDVVGKSVSGAVLMAKVQAMVRAFAPESASTGRLCERVNGELCDNEAADKMATLFYGVLDAERKTLQYTSAGHPRPILKRADGTVEQLENSGAVLGVFPSWKYEESLVRLAPGDLMLLFTDGITEAAKPGGEEFGEKRLIQVVEALAGELPSELNEKFFSVVKDWCGSHLADDATLIAIAAGAAKGRKVQPEARPALAA
jgi:serine phosphatase RsbU (regulator of sigma subunit)